MGLFASSRSAVRRPGVFPIEVASPRVIDGVSNGYLGLIFQGEWGPHNVIYKPTSSGDLMTTYFPAGSPRNSTGFRALKGRRKTAWALGRILAGSQGLLPPDPPTITNQGTSGAATYTYKVVAKNASGNSIASAAAITTTGNATLTVGNFNRLTWAAVSGATSYDVYRVSGGATQGRISTALAAVTLDDTGLAGGGETAPTTNTSGYERAVCFLLDSAGKCVATLLGKYHGSMPNGRMTAVVKAATDGVANHFDLDIVLTDSVTGTRTENYRNLQTIATAIYPTLTSSVLLGTFNLVSPAPSTRPANGTYTFGGGSNGANAFTAADYQTGLDAMANESNVRVVCVDDCGASLRSAVNANLVAYGVSKTDCQVILHGDQGVSWATVKSDVANYRSDRNIYAGKWVNIYDEAGTSEVSSPFSTFIGSAICGLQPQESHAWWDDKATDYYLGISSLQTDQFSSASETVQDEATEQGICLPIRLESGRFAALHDRTTSLSTDLRFSVTRRIKDYLALSIRAGIPSWVNGPMDLERRRRLYITLDNYMKSEVKKGRVASLVDGADPYRIDDKSENTADSMALGEYAVVIEATTPPPMEKLFVYLNAGPTVKVRTN